MTHTYFMYPVYASRLNQLSDLESPSEFISGNVWVGNDIIKDGDLSTRTYVITLSDARRADSPSVEREIGFLVSRIHDGTLQIAVGAHIFGPRLPENTRG